ncbi:VWA domain-containing protein [Borrelia coriaceae]|uniref:Membrane spanning protein n=1 Tax=Borrelia coriaceae ATCC 43381 TaxID=1408429 RepID=W5SZ17_9SPIR|nr:VWA domain-containing protein [Borrelia coriaceae]AHH10326.1 Putative membrane spanning protein [Borrelia coriaceae ATCC 43381]UPA16044.1 VWA domain-containing protein [Borrelia coriaceae]
MSIGNYYAFYLFIILFFVLFIYVYNFRKALPFFKTLSLMYVSNAYIKNYYIKKILMMLFFILSLTFLIVSILDISWGQKAVEDKRSNLRLSFVVDISRSMLTFDEGKSINRLESAKNLISLILNNFENAEYSLTIFKGKSLLVLPFSKDRVSLHKILNYIEPNLISSPGSFLGEGVFSAIKGVKDNSYYNFLIVLADGDEWGENNYYTFSKFVDAFNVKSFVVGIGSDKPSPLIDNDLNVKDRYGNMVKTMLNEDNLRLLTSALKGSYYHLYLQGTNYVINEIRNDIMKTSASDILLIGILRYKLFLAISFLFIVLYVFVKVAKWDETF